MAANMLDGESSICNQNPVTVVRARALADAKRFRALASIALRDGAPRADLRAANARAAARSVLAHARALSGLAGVPQTAD